jgi:hypothetical protein
MGGHPSAFERYIRDGVERADAASIDRLEQERFLPPNERFDTLGWWIFETAIRLEMHPAEAARLAMDGNLRQRNRVYDDLVKRIVPRARRLFPEAFPKRYDEIAVADQLAHWRQSGTGFVYFVQLEDNGPVKIGRGRDPERRLRALQTGSPHKLNLRHVVPGDHNLETALHHRFAPARISGEWFGAEYLQIILAFCAELAREAIEASPDGNPPSIVGAQVRGYRETLALRADIERHWRNGHPPDDIARFAGITREELDQHLAEMRRSTLYDVNRPGGHPSWVRPTGHERMRMAS